MRTYSLFGTPIIRRLALCLALLLSTAACDPAAISPWGGYKQG